MLVKWLQQRLLLSCQSHVTWLMGDSLMPHDHSFWHDRTNDYDSDVAPWLESQLIEKSNN
jgi:hypothetical protein